MAKVTITFEDMEEGVTVAVESDPPLPENIQEEAENLTDAQQMALSMAMMFDNQMQEEYEQQPEKKCCGSNSKCDEKHKKEGVCPRHKDTPPEQCCQD
jgi:hypothetical protein